MFVSVFFFLLILLFILFFIYIFSIFCIFLQCFFSSFFVLPFLHFPFVTQTISLHFSIFPFFADGPVAHVFRDIFFYRSGRVLERWKILQ